jgi:hypothetical protein
MPRFMPSTRLHHVLTPAIKVCNLVSKSDELIGISGVWKGFFMTASASTGVSENIVDRQAES